MPQRVPKSFVCIVVLFSAVAVWATVAQAQAETESYNPQERCGKLAAEVFAKEWGTGVSNTDDGQTIADYRSHYNFRLKKCFYLELSTTFPRGGDRHPLSSSRLYDLHESREIGDYH